MGTGLVTALATDGSKARAVLTPLEREACARLPGAHRQRDFRAGRLAVKRAASRALGGAQGPRIEQHVEVISAVGAPPRLVLVDSHSRRTPAAHRVSVSHRDGLAVAAVAQPGQRVGVDLERARSIDPTTARYFLSEEEQALAAGGDLTAFWCLKEAAWKALSLGRSTPFKHLELCGGRAGRGHMRGNGRLRAGWDGHAAPGGDGGSGTAPIEGISGSGAGRIHAVRVGGESIPVIAGLTTPWRGYLAAIVWIAGGEA